ncbi:MAG: AraC family transcriptional regulator [Bacteroidales bacterium]|nr:AraC family transcriptional regulator [Bacteroidales bacterium]
MTNSFHELDLGDLRKIFSSAQGENLSDAIFMAEQYYEERMEPFMKEPCRFNCYVALFCIDGDFTVEINLKPVRVRKNSLVIVIPGSICRVSEVDIDKLGKLHAVVIAVSKELMSTIRFDFNSLFNESVAAIDNPCITLDEKSHGICKKYFDIAKDLYISDLPGSRDALRYLASSIFYMLGSMWTSQIKEAQAHNPRRTPRSQTVMDSFLKLVAEYHNLERKVGFYADKLCLTPKYLSKLIKEASGRSAPDWIDSFVILEAKNMLKYSDMPVKEIVYLLHFPNQSVFYKFFKTHTGLTPNEYRNGEDKSF